MRPVAILSQGTLVALGTPADLKQQIGGDVISVETPDPEGLAKQIEAKFGATVQVVDNFLRIERPVGHEFIPQLVAAFPGQITSVTLAKPTLEDVFIRQTRTVSGQNPSALIPPPTERAKTVKSPLPRGEVKGDRGRTS